MIRDREVLLARLLSLLEGVEGHYSCLCGRKLRVGVSPELWQTAVLLRAGLEAGAVTDEEASRFALLEVD